MKFIRLIAVGLIFFFAGQSIHAQQYDRAIGQRFGYPLSVSYLF